MFPDFLAASPSAFSRAAFTSFCQSRSSAPASLPNWFLRILSRVVSIFLRASSVVNPSSSNSLRRYSIRLTVGLAPLIPFSMSLTAFLALSTYRLASFDRSSGESRPLTYALISDLTPASDTFIALSASFNLSAILENPSFCLSFIPSSTVSRNRSLAEFFTAAARRS